MLLLHLRRYTGIADDNRADHVDPSAFWQPPDRLLFRCLELHSTHSKKPTSWTVRIRLLLSFDLTLKMGSPECIRASLVAHLCSLVGFPGPQPVC